ncbi:MAG: hypothetical protein FJ308_07220, partial [Planctomycetes bacterium]|nr:hypothetical protein [Planctomycetota bacterium]
MRATRGFSIRIAVIICVATSLFNAVGCQFAPKKMPSVWPWKKSDEPKPIPDRILAVWSDSVLHQKGLPGVRGFGGRIYFYQKENTDPIEVDGSLAVYVFDADDISPATQQPLRKFVFTPDQFESHMSKTSFGPSYSVWLPWSEVGGPQMRLSLIARFEGRDGGSTVSDPTIKLLPGISKEDALAKSKAKKNPGKTDSAVQQASFVEGATTSAASPDTENAAGSKSFSTPKQNSRAKDVKTIDLPPSFQRHIRPNALNNSLGSSNSNESLGSMGNAPLPPGATPGNSGSSLMPTDTTTDRVKPALQESLGGSMVTTEVIDLRSRDQRWKRDSGSSSNW